MSLDRQKKKELSSAYQQTIRPMGIYAIRNTKNGKILVDSTLDLDGARNRLTFSKQTNLNSVIELRQDWQQYGADSFEFEELDRIKPLEDATGDPAELRQYKEDLKALLELWLEKLEPYGDKGYNRPRRT